MAYTKIEWANKSWNPVSGCSKTSTGCLYCYAERMAKRLAGRYGYPKDNPFSVTLHPDRLEEPLHWKKPAAIFVCSMGDLFHDDVPSEYIAQVWDTMFDAPQHAFMVLTKRPERLLEFAGWMNSHARRIDYDNVWLGVTAENQETADTRIPILLQIPAAKRFVSCEPLLGSIDLTAGYGAFRIGEQGVAREGVDWVIAGGETGPGARPMDLEWARSLRDQCAATDVPFFFKKAGQGKETPPDLMIREMPT